jgi:VWFA-related protein
MSIRRAGLAWTSWLAMAAAGLVAQTPPQQPSFRGGTELVAVDFLAIDAAGRPIANLKTSELTLSVDGKPREIQSLQFLELAPATLPPKGSAPLAKAVPLPFGSNLQQDAGRNIVLLFHHTTIQQGDERLARDGIARLVDGLTARDRVALITFPQGEVVVDLTTNHDRIRSALPSITGHAPPAGNTNAAIVDQTYRYVLRDLAALISGFESIAGPKVVVLVTQSLPTLSAATTDDYADVARAASRTRAQFFIVQPHTFGAMGVTTHYAVDAAGNSDHGPPSRVGAGIEDLAGAVGGQLFSLSGTADAAMERVASESSAYYLLGFTPTASEVNGKNHKIGLSVARPGVTIRARPSFVIDKPAAANSKPASPVTPETLLKDAASHADLPLRAVSYTFRAPQRNLLKVLVVVESPASETSLTAAAFALVDPKGRIAAQWSADKQDLASHPVVSAMTVKPGTYRVRASARDSAGRLGAVDYELDASLARVGSLETGALMIGVMRNKEFQPQFTFGPEPQATAYTEIYGVDAKRAQVRFETARTADSAALATIPATVSATKDPDRWIVTGSIPIASLPPGDVVLRAIISFDGAEGRVVRTLRKR